jgi:hypothetical protein
VFGFATIFGDDRYSQTWPSSRARARIWFLAACSWSPFDQREVRPRAANRCSGTRAERNSNLEYYCAYRRHLRCHLEIMEDLGMSPISEQLSDKPPLAFRVYMDARVIKHNRDREIKHRAWAPWRTRPAIDSRGSWG